MSLTSSTSVEGIQSPDAMVENDVQEVQCFGIKKTKGHMLVDDMIIKASSSVIIPSVRPHID